MRDGSITQSRASAAARGLMRNRDGGAGGVMEGWSDGVGAAWIGWATTRGAGADGAIVGSAVVKVIADAGDAAAEAAGAFVRELAAGTWPAAGS